MERGAAADHLSGPDSGVPPPEPRLAEIAAKSPLSIRGTKEMLNYARDHSVADSLGLRPFDPTKSEAQRGALNEVKVRVDSLINDWQVANKKPMPAEEKRKLMANELSTMVEVQGRFFGSDQVSVLGVKKDQLARVVVPPEDAQAILARYKAARGPDYKPTAEEIATAYLKKKQRDAAGIK